MQTEAGLAASPSLRVHRVFHRIGVVLGGLCLLVTVAAIGFAIAGLIGGNREGAITSVSIATLWFLIALALYILARSIGWIIAGAMKY